MSALWRGRVFPTIVTALAVAAAPSAVDAGRERLELRRVSLELPGPPASVLSSDLDGDGRADLVVVLAYSEIEEVDTARVENMVQITTVIPALFDRREVRAYLAGEDGSYRHAATLPLPTAVLHMESAGDIGVVAMTDDGLSRLRLVGAPGQRDLVLEPAIENEPVLSGTNNFYSSLSLAHDLDGDGRTDVVFPSTEGPSIWLWNGTELRHTDTVEPPEDETPATVRWLRLPEVVYVDGDDTPDLVFRGGRNPVHRGRVDVHLGNGDGTFRPLRRETTDCHDTGTDLRFAGSEPGVRPWPEDVATLRDVDGDRRAELVVMRERTRGEGMRKELKDTKRPIHLFRFHELTDELDVAAEPYFEAELEGHAFNLGGDELPFPIAQFEDLDGDGREELLTTTLRFSMFGAMKAMVTKQMGVGMGFHVYAQDPDGAFRKVPDLDLEEKLKLDFNNLRFGRFAQFAGDFDGDGRHDFVHLGRGSSVTIHAGREGCEYPKDPDLVLDVGEEPPSLDLVRIEDIDGDGRSDMRITRPLPSTDPDVTAPVRLELYLSGDTP